MLTDEEKRKIRARVSEASGEWHFDLMMFANEIERAVLGKVAGKQEPAQAAAIPEGYDVQIDNDGSVHVMCHKSKTATEVDDSVLIMYFYDLLSASPKP